MHNAIQDLTNSIKDSISNYNLDGFDKYWPQLLQTLSGIMIGFAIISLIFFVLNLNKGFVGKVSRIITYISSSLFFLLGLFLMLYGAGVFGYLGLDEAIDEVITEPKNYLITFLDTNVEGFTPFDSLYSIINAFINPFGFSSVQDITGSNILDKILIIPFIVGTAILMISILTVLFSALMYRNKTFKIAGIVFFVFYMMALLGGAIYFLYYSFQDIKLGTILGTLLNDKIDDISLRIETALRDAKTLDEINKIMEQISPDWNGEFVFGGNSINIWETISGIKGDELSEESKKDIIDNLVKFKENEWDNVYNWITNK
ncbi:hypothetical protein [[Acholeplasma] multilocale]|uniref:hypothetical protein n=1 Tax=[Acholeplasma] multilocale TaxID=264638 RepID=UPI00047E95A4|nr:hypothetical protein [[Acholeplasma] multilocale]